MHDDPLASQVDRPSDAGAEEMRRDYALAVGHQLEGRLAEADALCRAIAARDPSHAGAYHLLAVIEYRRGHFDEAIALLRTSLALAPDDVLARSHLGAALLARGDLHEAIATYRQAIVYEPNDAALHGNLGNALRRAGEGDAAMAAYRRALELAPLAADVRNNLATVQRDHALLNDAVASFEAAVRFAAGTPMEREIGSNLLFTLHFHPAYDEGALYAKHREWEARHAAPLADRIRAHPNDPSAERRLRVGYVSPNWYDHCQSLFTIPLLSSHDRARFEIYAYSDVDRPDAVTARIEGYVDAWRGVAGETDAGLADRVRGDGIDILVDLTMHMAHGRLLTFAERPAPVQVTWLAYPGTTGLSAIDYRLSDPYLDPPREGEGPYAETTVRLPESFWCYDPLALCPEPAWEVSPLPALTNGHVTFGALNNFCKVNDAVLRLWARVLMRVEHSRLVLLAPSGSARTRVQNVLQRHGVAAGRVEFVDRRARAHYLEVVGRIDLALDTFPYNGHTTSLDGYWMGVPIVTLVGPTIVGRAGLSQLSNLGLSSLVARTPDDFVAIAAAWARDLPRLSRLRSSLRARLEASPLMNAPRFAKSLEAAYRSMWRRWCAMGQKRR